MALAGEEEVFDLTVEEASHYVTWGGVVAQNCGFDELTHFSERQYIELLARCRSAHGIRCRTRATTNPGSRGHEWVFNRWAPWLDPDAPVRALPGQELFFLRDKDGIDRVVPKGTRNALDRAFIPARLEDNPRLFEDGQYAAKLEQLDLVRRAQLRDGDWLIKPAKGMYFKREWFTFVNADEVPVDARRYRYWDLAATEPEKGKDPDWTVGVKLAMTKGKKVYVEDVARMRGNPGDVEAFVKATAELDGHDVRIGIEQEPGASGKSAVAAYLRLLSGWTFKAFKKRVNKIVAAGPLSAQAFGKNVLIVRAPWNEPFMRVLEQFPEGSHDDDVDAASGSFTALSDGSQGNTTHGRVAFVRPGLDDRAAGY